MYVDVFDDVFVLCCDKVFEFFVFFVGVIGCFRCGGDD